MSIKVCLREVMTHGLFNEIISINIDTHTTFFDGIEQIGLIVFSQFGALYDTVNNQSGDEPFTSYGEICYDDILLTLDYLTTNECRNFITNKKKIIDKLSHDFNSMKLYLELNKDCEFFSVYIL